MNETPGPKDRCWKRVYTGSFRGTLCAKPPTRFENGRWCCDLHCKAGLAKRDARRIERSNAQSAQWKRERDERILFTHRAATQPALLEAARLVLATDARRGNGSDAEDAICKAMSQLQSAVKAAEKGPQ